MQTNGTFVNIQDWMLQYDLDLTETVIFAIIHTFSMNGRCKYDGSRRYLAYHAKCSTDKVDKSLKKMRDMGLIEKTEIFREGVKFCEYVSTVGSRYERQVAADNGGVGAGSGRGEADIYGGGGRYGRHNNKEENKELNIKENNITRAFDFKKALMDLGISEQTAADWMAVRKNAKATNTKTAFEALKTQIEKIVRRYDVTAEQVAAFAVGKDWKGINAEWDAVKQIKNAIAGANNGGYDPSLPF